MTLIDPNEMRQRRQLVRQVSCYASVGLEMGLSIAACVLGGAWVDGKFDTAPGFVLGGLALGLATAGHILYRAAKRANAEFKEQ